MVVLGFTSIIVTIVYLFKFLKIIYKDNNIFRDGKINSYSENKSKLFDYVLILTISNFVLLLCKQSLYNFILQLFNYLTLLI